MASDGYGCGSGDGDGEVVDELNGAGSVIRNVADPSIISLTRQSHTALIANDDHVIADDRRREA